MRRFQKLLAGLALCLCITAPAVAGTPVVLRAEISTESRVTLGDLFEGAGRAANIVVAPAPPAGGTTMIDAATLQRLAVTNGLSWTNERGLRRVIIRSGVLARAETGEPAAAPSSAAALPQGKGVEVLTWSRSIETGDLISAEDLTWSMMPAQPAGSARDAEQLIGKVAKRPLRSGSAATTRDVGAAMVIKKDDAVSVAYNFGGVSVTLQAKAMGPAAAGETVSLMNTQSKKIIQALAIGPGKAVVGPEADQMRANSQSLALR